MSSDNLYTPPNQNGENKTQGNKKNNDNDFQDQIVNLNKALKSNPKFVCCPYCNKQGNTKVEQSCSVCTGVLCVVGLGVFWALIQCCRSKDINCRDADHYCVGCGNKLASYKST